MKSEKVNGFTLIELLAVIVILAIILVIAVPKILNVIEETKKDSLKNTAQLIADSAEKEKISNELLEKDYDITCKRVAKITDEDYASCKITFDEEGNAKVSIIGKGKFDGLAVIDGTKMSSDVIELELPEYGVGKTYIENLYNNEILRKANDLKKDNTPDENKRYYGSNPNNYVRFNNELWRIIGVFGENIKLVRKDSLGVLSWDVSDGVNNNWGVNQWGESTYEDGNNYVGSSLYRYLNELYYGGNQVNCWRINYEKNVFQTVECPKDDDGNFLKLDDTAKSLIDNYTWNVGAIEGNTREDTLAFYQAERGTKIGKICSGGKVCNDTVVRTTEWTGYVGLPYPTDYSYASENEACETNMNIRNSSNGGVCGENNWLHRKTKTWYLSPFADSTHADMTWFVWNDGVVGAQNAGYSNDVIPSIYLKSNVQIISGAGTSDNPYVLKLG